MNERYEELKGLFEMVTICLFMAGMLALPLVLVLAPTMTFVLIGGLASLALGYGFMAMVLAGYELVKKW